MSSSTESSGLPSKKPRKTDHIEHDHISNLPDCIISRILSGLPTKDAVRTSVLSKDWEYKWTTIYNIDICCMETYKTKRKETTFVNFVETTLIFAQNVQSFRLSCYLNHYTDRVKTWISVALSRNIHCLQISYRHASIKIIMPRSLFNCYSLRKLELNMHCTLKVPARICYPYLNSLKLQGVEILNELSDADPVTFNLPALETFELKYCKWLNVKFVEIYAPKMSSFEYDTPSGARVNDYSIKISGDSLVRFQSYGDNLAENIILSGSPPVVYASFAHHSQYNLAKRGFQIRKLLKGFSSLEELVIVGCVAKAIAQSKRGLSLPKYYRMERLFLYAHANTEALLELLHAAPCMKFLHIVMSGLSNYDYDAMDYVPSCIVSHLEEVKLVCFEGKKHEFELVKFFLKNAFQLKRVCVCISTRCHPHPPSPWIPRNEVLEELSTYPKASTCVTIDVTWQWPTANV